MGQARGLGHIKDFDARFIRVGPGVSDIIKDSSTKVYSGQTSGLGHIKDFLPSLFGSGQGSRAYQVFFYQVIRIGPGVSEIKIFQFDLEFCFCLLQNQNVSAN